MQQAALIALSWVFSGINIINLMKTPQDSSSRMTNIPRTVLSAPFFWLLSTGLGVLEQQDFARGTALVASGGMLLDKSTPNWEKCAGAFFIAAQLITFATMSPSIRDITSASFAIIAGLTLWAGSAQYFWSELTEYLRSQPASPLHEQLNSDSDNVDPDTEERFSRNNV